MQYDARFHSSVVHNMRDLFRRAKRNEDLSALSDGAIWVCFEATLGVECAEDEIIPGLTSQETTHVMAMVEAIDARV